MPKQTPSQTVGPFFHLGLTREDAGDLTHAETEGARIRIEGRVLDGNGDPVPDAMLEIWQANTHGRYRHPDDDRDDIPLDAAFVGYGRVGTNADGRYAFDTIKPGRVPAPDGGWQAPHINLVVFARGMLIHSNTRIYFSDEPTNDDDPVLSHLVAEERRPTLIAQRDDASVDPALYQFDVALQGERETVFFEA
jgi:protocatechuate 3,4-dioxygenase alpha subunit